MQSSTAVVQSEPLYVIPGLTEWNHHTIRKLERGSIRRFMENNRAYLKGRVLDFGCGQKPYADLVSGQYVPYEYGDPTPEPPFDAIMCNQVVQYLPNPPEQIRQFGLILKPKGYLVMTYPTNWDEVEQEDLFRFTKTGMNRMLKRAKFNVIVHQKRAEIQLGGFRFPLGYGVVARCDIPYTVRSQYDQEQTVALFTDMIRSKRPFTFVKYGDGALECIYHTNACKYTCDREHYTPELAKLLQESWDTFMSAAGSSGGVYVGDWMTASFTDDCESHRYLTEWEDFIKGRAPVFVHFESLLIMRESRSIVDFYRAVRDDDRIKVLVGRPEMVEAAKMLRSNYVCIPMTHDLIPYLEYIESSVDQYNPDVVLYGAGMAGNVAMSRLLLKRPETTFISIGSALDPIFVGRTRTDQLSQLQAQHLFRDLL